MDFGKALTFVTEDPKWITKVLIGGAILLVGVLFSWLLLVPLIAAAAILFGYTLNVTKNVAENSSSPLPEWTDFGALFMRGIYAVIGLVIYYLPAIVLACCGAAIPYLAGAAGNAAGGNNAGSSLASALSIVTFCFSCLQSVYSLVAGLTLAAPLTRFAMSKNQLNVFWDFKGNIDFISKNVGNFVMTIVIGFVAGVIGSLGLIACIIGVFFTGFWAQLAQAHAMGQLWKNRVASAAG